MDRKSAVKGIIVVLVLAVAAAGVFGVMNYMEKRSTGSDHDKGKVERESAAPDPTYLFLGDLEYEVTDNIKAYLLVGTDGAGSKPNAKHYHGPMSDYIMLVLIDKTKETYGFVQIDRDTMTDIVQIGEDGDEEAAATVEEQICTATWFGKDLNQGLRNLMESVSYLMGGLEIEGYYSINMDDIAKLNHAVGGVTVKIEDDFSEYDEEMVPGAEVHLTDEQAELFVRSRMEIGDGTNESRMRRQRAYMTALMDQAKQKMADDKSFAIDVYQELNGVATTNIQGSRVSAIANLLYKFENKGIFDIDGEHTVGRTDRDKKDYVQFYADEDSITMILKELMYLDDGHEY